MSETCASCGGTVLATSTGPLNPEPTRLGVLRPDGTGFTRGDVIRAGSKHRGHHRHVCAPGAKRNRARDDGRPEPAGSPRQDSLFPIPEAADKTRSRGS